MFDRAIRIMREWLLLPADAREAIRSGAWPALERRWLASHPFCAACGGRSALQVHHKIPVSWDASLELVETNLITLCAPHHLLFGHLMDWKSRNPAVEADAAAWLAKIHARPYPPARFVI
jgi:5-methylcytosine-specific restriction enzyme A